MRNKNGSREWDMEREMCMSILVGFKVTIERERTWYLRRRKAGQRKRVTNTNKDRRTAAAAENR